MKVVTGCVKNNFTFGIRKLLMNSKTSLVSLDIR